MIDKSIVVKNKEYENNRDLENILFGDMAGVVEPCVEYIGEDKDMYDLLAEHGYFRSKNDARRNWRRSGREIPGGFSDFRDIGKLHNRLTIWNPI